MSGTNYKTVKPRTLDGVKSLAKTIKKREGCAHYVALDRAAQQAGYANYNLARIGLRNT